MENSEIPDDYRDHTERIDWEIEMRMMDIEDNKPIPDPFFDDEEIKDYVKEEVK